MGLPGRPGPQDAGPGLGWPLGEDGIEQGCQLAGIGGHAASCGGGLQQGSPWRIDRAAAASWSKPRARLRARSASSWAATIRRSCWRIGAGAGQLSQRGPIRAAGMAVRAQRDGFPGDRGGLIAPIK